MAENVKYRLEVTEPQLRVINAALEEFFRLPLNQWFDLAERLSMKGYNNPYGDNVLFERYLARKRTAQTFLEAVGRILWPDGPPRKDDEQMIAEDIWRTVRHKLYLDSGSTDTWMVDAGPVYQWGPEPLPKVEKVTEEGAEDHG